MAMVTNFGVMVVDCEAMAKISGSLKVKRSERLRRKEGLRPFSLN